MDYSDITLFSLMKQKMEYLGQRQAVLAQNIANIDTPGYKSMDIKAPTFDQMLNPAASNIGMSLTNPMHIQGMMASGGTYKEGNTRNPLEINFNKNEVTLEDEMQKISSTQADYQVVTNLYRKTVDMFKTALGRQGGA